jgi:excisionase family DNA binding protein
MTYRLRARESLVFVPSRVAYLIEKGTNIKKLRLQLRETDPEATAVLKDLVNAAYDWPGFPETETKLDSQQKPAEDSGWLSTGKAAAGAKVSPQAIRKAIREGRLLATEDPATGRYRINRQDLTQWLANRPEH